MLHDTIQKKYGRDSTWPPVVCRRLLCCFLRRRPCAVVFLFCWGGYLFAQLMAFEELSTDPFTHRYLLKFPETAIHYPVQASFRTYSFAGHVNAQKVYSIFLGHSCFVVVVMELGRRVQGDTGNF